MVLRFLKSKAFRAIPPLSRPGPLSPLLRYKQVLLCTCQASSFSLRRGSRALLAKVPSKPLSSSRVKCNVLSFPGLGRGIDIAVCFPYVFLHGFPFVFLTRFILEDPCPVFPLAPPPIGSNKLYLGSPPDGCCARASPPRRAKEVMAAFTSAR